MTLDSDPKPEARSPKPLLFATQRYGYLAAEIARLTGWEPRQRHAQDVPSDGEHFTCASTPTPADRDVMLIGGTVDDAATLEIYDLACGLVTGGAYRLSLAMPFFGYSTMERSIRSGEVVTAKTRARLLSSIPMASRGTQVFLLDLHVAAIAHYFEGAIRPIHVYGKSLVIAAARRLGGDSFVLACTDAGRAKWVVEFARERPRRRGRVRLQAPASTASRPRSPACRRACTASAS